MSPLEDRIRTLITGLFVLQERKSVPFQLIESSFAFFFSVRTALALAPQGSPSLFWGIGSLTVLELVDWLDVSLRDLVCASLALRLLACATRLSFYKRFKGGTQFLMLAKQVPYLLNHIPIQKDPFLKRTVVDRILWFILYLISKEPKRYV